MTVTSTRSRLLLLLLILGLIAPAAPSVGACCGAAHPVASLEVVDAASSPCQSCCPGENEPEDRAPRGDDRTDPCDGSCECALCGCMAGHLVLLRVRGAGIPIHLITDRIVDRTPRLAPQDSTDELKRPPRA